MFSTICRATLKIKPVARYLQRGGELGELICVKRGKNSAQRSETLEDIICRFVLSCVLFQCFCLLCAVFTMFKVARFLECCFACWAALLQLTAGWFFYLIGGMKCTVFWGRVLRNVAFIGLLE